LASELYLYFSELQQIPQIAVEIFKYCYRAVAILYRVAHEDNAFALVRVEVAPKVVCVKKEKYATTSLISYA
jgi:hypothetical protein